MSSIDTLNEKSILVIIDPSKDSHIALERALITSRLRNEKPHLHLFLSVDKENTDLKARNPKLYRDQQWIDSITNLIQEEGLQYTLEICWSREWNEAVLNCADRMQPELILVPDCIQESRRSYFTNAKWALLRSSPCPVMIVRPNASNQRRCVLAAINIQNEDQGIMALNNRVISKGLATAKLYNSDFHIVNAYPNSMHYPDTDKIKKITGLASNKIHTKEGDPAEVISFYAQKLKADLVLIGTRSRRGAIEIMKGKTSDRILNKLTQDVMAYS